METTNLILTEVECLQCKNKFKALKITERMFCKLACRVNFASIDRRYKDPVINKMTMMAKHILLPNEKW